MDYLSGDTVLLYFFVSAGAALTGLSFHGKGTIAAGLCLHLHDLFKAGDELLAFDLIIHKPPLT